jgi:hypothetical protein
MDMLVTFLTTNPIGIGLLVVIIVGLVVTVISLIIKGYTFEKTGPGMTDFKIFKTSKKKKKKRGDDDDEEEDESPGKKVTVATTQNLSGKINNLFETSFTELLAIKNKYREENRRVQKEALNKAIGSITLSYTQKYEKIENIERMTEILELYLKRDFNFIMSEKLDGIRKTAEYGTVKKEDILNNISKYTDEIMMQIKNVVIKFDLINDKNSLYMLLEESKSTVRDSLEEVIKQFVSFNDNEQREILEIRHKQIELLNKELNYLLEG